MRNIAVYLGSFGLLYLSMLACNQKLINYYDTVSLYALCFFGLAVSLCFSRNDWRTLYRALSTKGHRAELQAAHRQLKQIWTFLLAAVGINIMLLLVISLSDLTNMATLGTLLAGFLLNGIYLLLLRWFIFQPLWLKLKLKAIKMGADL